MQCVILFSTLGKLCTVYLNKSMFVLILIEGKNEYLSQWSWRNPSHKRHDLLLRGTRLPSPSNKLNNQTFYLLLTFGLPTTSLFKNNTISFLCKLIER